MSFQFPNIMHWASNLPSHLINCKDIHRSTYAGIILQVYKINYMSHMPEQKTRHYPQSNDSTITWPALTHSPCSTHLSILLLLFFQVQDCSQIVNKHDVEMQNLPLMKQFLWDAGKWGKLTITSHHHTVSNPTSISQNNLQEVNQKFKWNCQVRLVSWR
jgi:hypothetical protein